MTTPDTRPDGWQDMATAPRDGTRIWAIVGEAECDRHIHWVGRSFEIRHEGYTPSGYDLGWSLFPGYGGCGDSMFAAWRPLPAPPKGGESNG